MRRADGAVRLGAGEEFDRIRRLLDGAPTAAPGVVLGAGDDAAVVDGGRLAISTDLSVEHVHFRREWLSGEQIGYRAVMAALSDVAAVAADPIGVLTSIALPAADPLLESLGRGIHEACEVAGVVLLGGDLSVTEGPVVIDVTAVGRVVGPAARSGARAGDEVWVTGTLGAAAAAVWLLEQGREVPRSLLEAFARPRPRFAEARWLKEHGDPRGMIDLSDGLGGDAGHLAAAAGVRLSIDWESLPLAAEAESLVGAERARRFALSGGEDYELCVVLPEGRGDKLAPEFRATFGLPMTRVGWVEEGSGVRLVDPSGADHEARGFDHFAGDDS